MTNTILTGEYSFDFIDESEYQNRDLRGVINSLVKSGVIFENYYSCIVNLVFEGANRFATIANGKVVFNDGAVFATQGTKIPVSGSGYVYFLREGDTVTAEFGALPDGDYVLLAQIVSIYIIDKREIAVLKMGVE